MIILVANLGSTSFKYRLFDMAGEKQLARGGVERIGSPESPCFAEIGGQRQELKASVPDHAAAVKQCLTQLTDPASGCLKDASEVAAIGFDAVALGNHEFNYGLELLDTWIGQMRAPVLAANAVHAGTDRPAYRPYIIKRMHVPGHPPIRVGLLGLTNPGVAIWDKANVSGKLDFLDLVETAKRWVPIIRRQGVDVMVVSAHAGDSGLSSYGGDLPVDVRAPEIFQCVPDVEGDCTGRSCGGHGSCVVAGRDAICACQPGYSGADCQDCAPSYERDTAGACVLGAACRAAKCGGHGACVPAAGGEVACQCDAGYPGPDCGGAPLSIAAASETLTLYDAQQVVLTRSGKSYPFDIDAFRKHNLVHGLDEIGLTLAHADEIRAFEERRRAEQPWLFG